MRKSKKQKRKGLKKLRSLKSGGRNVEREGEPALEIERTEFARH